MRRHYVFLLRSGTSQEKLETLTTPIQHCICNKTPTPQENKGYTDWETGKTIFVHRWHDCPCKKSQGIKNEKHPGINKGLYSKIAGYKIKVQKSSTFLYTSNEQFTFEIKKHNTIYISTQKKKKKEYLGTKQTN